MNKLEIYDRLRHVICPFDKVLGYIPKKGRILDIGSGYGTFAILMAEQEEREIIGIELNKKKIDIAKSRTKDFKNLDFIFVDINDFDTDKKFNVIVCIDVLHHINLANHKNIFEKVYRLLANDGIFIIKELDTRPYHKYLWSYIHDIILNGSPNYLSNKDISSQLKENNFEIIFNENVCNMLYQHYILVCERKSKYINEII